MTQQLHHLLRTLIPIPSPSDETFTLFSTHQSSLPLGLFYPSKPTISFTLGSHIIPITQSPTLLNSSLPGGTTGAMLWNVSPLISHWLFDGKGGNILFNAGILGGGKNVIELGSGVSGIVGLGIIGRMIQERTAEEEKRGKVILTDQHYTLKLLRQNLLSGLEAMNLPIPASFRSLEPLLSPKTKNKNNSKKVDVRGKEKAKRCTPDVQILELDWETSDLTSLAEETGVGEEGFDMVIACDCIYNEALIGPFVSTCVEICRIRGVTLLTSNPAGTSDPEEGETGKAMEEERNPTICMVAQQLRSPDVFEEWLREFHRYFHVWRIPDELLGDELGVDDGYVVHIGILR